MKHTPPSGLSVSHSCIFGKPFVREQIDPRINMIWGKRFGVVRTPFGRLRALFRSEHCSVVNPYESRFCPYSERDCAIAFYQCVSLTVQNAHDSRSATGYFRKVARSLAAVRADEKPLARDDETLADAKTSTAGSGDPGIVGPRGEEGQGMRRTRPVRIDALLGSLDLGPRPRRADDGQAGTE